MHTSRVFQKKDILRYRNIKPVKVLKNNLNLN
jgi:hypothetical protein